MSHPVALFHHPNFLDYDFGPSHPLRPERLSAGLDLLEAVGIYFPSADTPTIGPASRTEIELVHDAAYIDAVIGAGSGDAPSQIYAEYGLHSTDNPPFPSMHEAAAMVTGGTVAAAREIMHGNILHAFNPAGGLHHAWRSRASGFCIYNDPAVAAAVLAEEFGARVFYVDFDCHHGDGVQWIFYEDPRIFTLSFHETGRFLFPGTGYPEEIGQGAGAGTSANVPFAPFTQDASWLQAIETILPPLVERFAPDILITNHGCDTHDWDPITHLSLSTAAFERQAALVHEIAHSATDGRWMAVGSGGYDWRRVVPRSWAILWSEMSERVLPERLPEEWMQRWDTDARDRMPPTFLDDPRTFRHIPRRDEIDELNLEAVAQTKRHLGL
jgi:acetoin utilization protein AcuC